MAHFGEGAARLSGAAAMLLGWRPEEFWESTPAELSLALRGPGDMNAGLDRGIIETLRLRFPDDEMKHG